MSGDRVRFADGFVDDVASLLVGTDTRAGEYLAQAPVLAVAACGRFASHITYGEMDRFAAEVRKGPKLKDLLTSYGVSAPLRKLNPGELRLRDRAILIELSRLDNSTLAQSIPAESQRVWLDGVSKWTVLAPEGKRNYAAFNVGWIARRLGENLARYEQVSALVDYLGRGHHTLNERWSWDRAMQAVTDWHRSLRDEAALRRLAAVEKRALTFDTVICKSKLPDHASVEGFDFRVLRTLRHLRDEGEAMHHCVASYADEVSRGYCAIVSVSRDGVCVGTMQIDSRGTVAQLKAHCNAPVTPAVRKACDLYALLHWPAPSAA